MPVARLEKEHEALRARASARKYLSETGSGPSYQEQLRQEQARAKYKNKVSQYIAQENPDTFQVISDPRIRDNTLQVIAERNAKALSRRKPASDQAQDYSTEELSTTKLDQSNWSETWKQARDSETGQTYFWNQVTTAIDRFSDLEQALTAKSKLDKILEQCGQNIPDGKASSTNTETIRLRQHITSKGISSSNSTDSDTAQELPVNSGQALASVAPFTTSRSSKVTRSFPPSRTNVAEDNPRNNKRQRSLKENRKIDPLDPTAGRGKLADALFSQGEYAADTTANGPLYQ
uniref:AlNc14C396G11331 protein n=1 Tax=Albugo laibachii Nc14 TaxID=890382 RepID=F0WYS0_9STRA|nr:AlNc14C396G11331 [Albugo laibachii Nc14]|eukprot:CCA26629.1 AlNc14C396G11331 [Albugo laibachii Nc14]